MLQIYSIKSMIKWQNFSYLSPNRIFYAYFFHFFLVFLVAYPKKWYICSIFKEMRMGLEFGKWLLDVAKYMLTALLLANFFGDLKSPAAIACVIILTLLVLGLGLWLINKFSDKNNKRKENKYDNARN